MRSAGPYSAPSSPYYPTSNSHKLQTNSYYVQSSPYYNSPQAFSPSKGSSNTFVKPPDLPTPKWILISTRMLSLVLGFVFLFGLSSPFFSLPAIPYFEDASTLTTLPNIVFYTVFGTIIAKPVMTGISEIFQLTSQRRLTNYRSIFEIEVWTKLASGTIFFAWEMNWRCWAATLLTLLVAILHGLYIAGFVSMLTPQLTNTSSKVISTFQLDLGVDSGICQGWYEEQLLPLRACNLEYEKLSLSYQDCQASSQLFGVLEAAKASMLSHALSDNPTPDPKHYVSSLSRLGSTRILGSTAGVIPMGSYGIDSHPISSDISLNTTTIDLVFTKISTTIKQSHPGRYTNYTLTLQGVDATVSCLYDDQPGSHVVWSSQLPGPQLSVVAGNGSLSDNTWIYYLRSCLENCGRSDPTAPDAAYGSIGSMTCTIRPQLKDIRTTYNSTLDAFVMEPIAGSNTVSTQPTLLFNAIASLTQQMLVHTNTRHGSLIASLVDDLAVSEFGLPSGAKHDKYSALVASMIKGVFEYEATLLRLRMSNSTFEAPDECRRPVQGSTSLPTMAMKDHKPIPTLVMMTTVCAISAIGLLWSSWVSYKGLRAGLPFDPTVVISLVGASAAGGLQFGPTVVGDPDDRTVRSTKVRYAELSTWDGEPDRWGLVALDGGKKGESENLGECVELLPNAHGVRLPLPAFNRS